MNENKIEIVRKFGSYNGRRYGRPWGAIIRYQGSKPIYEFVDHAYVGNDSGGIVYVSANVGDIVAIGQRDGRGNNSSNCWCVVHEDGSCQEVDQPTAFNHWREQLRLHGQAQPLVTCHKG